MKLSIWYRNGLNKYLSEHGFVHFATGEPVLNNFDRGRAFMIDIENKTFGLKDMVHSEDVDDANMLTDWFESTGKIPAIEIEKSKQESIIKQ